MKTNLTVATTDDRMFYLQRLLADVEFERDTHVYAPNILIDSEKLAKVRDGGCVVCGKYEAGLQNAAKERGIDIFDMMKNERFLAVNSRLTAEGALMLALEKLAISINDARAMILGFGRMGAAVARLLNRFDTYLTVATGSSLRPAYAFAKSVTPLENFDFSQQDLIINTVPQPIVSDAELLTMRTDAVYIDLASRPAINLDYAKYLGIDADIYPALPAKVCPLAAANAIRAYISEVIK